MGSIRRKVQRDDLRGRGVCERGGGSLFMANVLQGKQCKH